jgi:hypothetical protein
MAKKEAKKSNLFLIITITNKKAQQHEIGLIKTNLDVLQGRIKKTNGGRLDLFNVPFQNVFYSRSNL